MNLLKNKKIAVVGGGPGGLTMARLLQMNGADVKVYERGAHKHARMQGATLDLHEESGLKALKEAGLMDAFWKNYRPGADRLRIVDKNADVVYDDANEKENEQSRPEIDRGPLQNILLDSLAPDTVVWNSHFLSLSKQDDFWKLDFKNGNSALADIVIAADGANSKLRPYITSIRPFFAGITIVEGTVYHSEMKTPNIHKLLNGGKIFALDDEKTLIVSSKGDGSLVFYTGNKTRENWVRDCGIDFADNAQVLTWFKKEYLGWNGAWDELFENAVSNFTPRPQYCMPLDQTWESLPNLTMLGDAAHLMPPYAGEGVNMAMVDALELSQCLLNDDFINIHSAIASYEKQMLERSSETAKQTLESTEALHSPGASEWLISLIS
ncbi:FAD-dependent oxidoreductase [Dyadobacter subterraneus]|uniref:Flavin-dependent monooxygenase n=1 Tax=Dyadobacter subterraneus TaxID=2773304 RepID=A0ABR9WBK3_9BACT|nr:NAD(P)/FAD-dependent oxidoreductase [Dyadobacter subterraneus]MBE9462867.1 FAD-dependent monooxygenase [Dyadobacter subterraneus]